MKHKSKGADLMNNEYLKCKTWDGGSPNGKPRVFFTCHPADFERSFEKICADIFAAQDCAIFYTPDMEYRIPQENMELDIAAMNLIVIPVSLKLLLEPNRAMDIDFPFAREQGITVLPIMIETGFDSVYGRTDKFGKRQYLDSVTTDPTAVPYKEKLKKFLHSVLVDDETAQRIRRAFDAYIFLSYRKKDRRFANELMRLIHKNPICRDIAIWYDEYLVPSEEFDENIRKALEKSELFTLLVTPNLINEENYVRTHEYPQARGSGKPIFPVEMEKTDRKKLEEQFEGIPKCINVKDEDIVTKALLERIKKIGAVKNDSEPEHNFLIGLAYLDGIDVEINRERAVGLITSAAEAGLIEAMEKLYDMYNDGIGVELDYRKSLYWAKRNAEQCEKDYGEEDEHTLVALRSLAFAYCNNGQYSNALEIDEKVYKLSCKVMGEEHPNTLASLNNLVLTYNELGEYQKALELRKKTYERRCRVLGKEHPDTLISLNNLAYEYGELSEHQKALELRKKTYERRCRVLGEEHPDTLISLNNLAHEYGELGEHQKVLELNKNVYELCSKVLGEEHPDTLISLSNLARKYGELGEHQKALELTKKVYELRCRVLGEEHPDTLTSLNNLAYEYGELGEHQKALELHKKTYEQRCRVQGEEHPDTLISLNNLAYEYGELGEHQKALELHKKTYEQRCRVQGEEHPDTLISLNNLAYEYGELGEHQKAFELKKTYKQRCKAQRKEHFYASVSLNNLAYEYGEPDKYQKALAGDIPNRCQVCNHAVFSGAKFCPYCGAKMVIEKSAVKLSRVEFSAIAPKRLVKGEYSIIDVVMYEESYRHIVDEIRKQADSETQEKKSGKVKVQEEAKIKVILSSNDIEVDDNETTGVWQGSYLSFSFPVYLPENYKKRQVLFLVKVFINNPELFTTLPRMWLKAT